MLVQNLLIIALGGSCGAVLRYLASGLVHRFITVSFPWGTLTVNLIGSLLIGLSWGIFEESIIAPQVKTFILMGKKEFSMQLYFVYLFAIIYDRHLF